MHCTLHSHQVRCGRARLHRVGQQQAGGGALRQGCGRGSGRGVAVAGAYRLSRHAHNMCSVVGGEIRWRMVEAGMPSQGKARSVGGGR